MWKRIKLEKGGFETFRPDYLDAKEKLDLVSKLNMQTNMDKLSQ